MKLTILQIELNPDEVRAGLHQDLTRTTLTESGREGRAMLPTSPSPQYYLPPHLSTPIEAPCELPRETSQLPQSVSKPFHLWAWIKPRLLPVCILAGLLLGGGIVLFHLPGNLSQVSEQPADGAMPNLAAETDLKEPLLPQEEPGREPAAASSDIPNVSFPAVPQ